MRIAMLASSALGLALLAGPSVAAAKPRVAAAHAAGVQDPASAMQKSPADLAQGKAFFTGVCGAYCHKMTPVHNDAPYLFGCDFKHGGSSRQIFYTITHGVPGTRMVSFKDAITDQDLWRIVAYLKSASQCKGAPGAP